MSALAVIFITVLICVEVDFFAVLYCNEISEWLKAKSDEVRARAESLRNANPAYNAGYSTGYTDGKIDGMKTFAREETPDLPDHKEGTE